MAFRPVLLCSRNCLRLRNSFYFSTKIVDSQLKIPQNKIKIPQNFPQKTLLPKPILTASICGTDFVRPISALPVSEVVQSVRKLKEVGEFSLSFFAKELAGIYDEITATLDCDLPELVELAKYHFKSHGKAFRPMVVLLMANACGKHSRDLTASVVQKQRSVALIAEMIHTASLIHDDVIDEAETRRNLPSLHKICGEKKAVLTGDYILSVASRELARLRNPDVIICLAQVIEDLVKGELMQLANRDTTVAGRFASYLSKTYHKTASLLANSCKAVAMLSECPAEIVERAYLFGKNVGMAFQIVDDYLDFVSSSDQMGKPTSVDLQLGLATAPVLYAAEKEPRLYELIDRRFSKAGDVEFSRQAVFKHKSVDQARELAKRYSQEAILQLNGIADGREHEALLKVVESLLNRTK